MPGDMFLEIDGIKGESVDKTRKDNIEILGWSWGISQSGSMQRGTGGGSGRANVQDISFTKYTDKATALLVNACVQGKPLKKAMLIVRKAGGKPLEYFGILLEDVLITSVSMGGSQSSELLSESVTLNFAKYTVSYAKQSKTGTGGPVVSSGFDMAKNQPSG